MHAVVINLDRRIDRFEKFKNRCPIKNVQRFSAFDGKNLDKYDNPFIKNCLNMNKSYNPSVLGCALSHFFLWSEIAKMPEKSRVMIMEDDVDFCEDFNKIIVPDNIDILYLGGRGIWGKNFCPPEKDLNLGWSLVNFNAGSRKLYIRKKSNLSGFLTDRCTECYIINPKTARLLAEYCAPRLVNKAIDALMDEYIANYNNFYVLEIFPHPCFTINEDDSNVDKIFPIKINAYLHVNNKDELLVNPIKIGFTDFWPNFNVEYNFFTLILSNHLSIVVDNKNPDVLFYSNFGDQHKNFNCKKVYFTGENTRPDLTNDFALGFDYIEADNYSRLPLWYLFLDIFNCDKNKIGDPYPLSLQLQVPLKRDRFCAFITSTPSYFRDSFFKLLSIYKRVDSAGKVLNNTYELQLMSKRNDIKWTEGKFLFLQKYKFCICFENSSFPGYITEKLIHAKLAGCIPIYWGDPTIHQQFNTKAFINVHQYPNISDVIELIKKIDQDDQEYEKIAREPLLSNLIEPLKESINKLIKKLQL